MDKLSEHAIRMLEIADKPYSNEYGMINKDWKDHSDIAQAVYDLILQVQMLKMADRKTENSSEKPNNCEDEYSCDTCKHNKLEWYSEICDGCCGAHSNYEPKTEPTQNQRIETMSCQECKRWIYDDRWGWFCPLKGQDECHYEPKTEPQTEREGE